MNLIEFCKKSILKHINLFLTNMFPLYNESIFLTILNLIFKFIVEIRNIYLIKGLIWLIRGRNSSLLNGSKQIIKWNIYFKHWPFELISSSVWPCLWISWLIVVEILLLRVIPFSYFMNIWNILQLYLHFLGSTSQI